MAVNACLQALVKFEGCEAILQKSLPEAEAALPNTEMQTKLQEVPSNAAVNQTSIDLELPSNMSARNASCLPMRPVVHQRQLLCARQSKSPVSGA